MDPLQAGSSRLRALWLVAIASPDGAVETGANLSHPPVTEKLVARLWDDQRPFLLPLATTDGQEIQVVYRGRRRWDRGPDFTGALIAGADGALHNGDVEIHVRSSDWRAHGHHRDPHYNSVILQVVMWDDAPEPTVRQDGAVVPVLALGARLSAPLEALPEVSGGEGPLFSPCWRGSPDDGDLVALLVSLGMERFEAKAARFESDLACFERSAISHQPPTHGPVPFGDSADQVLYIGMADALGYTGNREPFRRLAELVPIETLMAFSDRHPPLAIEALIIGAAGLLPSQRGFLTSRDDPYAQALEERWASIGPALVGHAMKAGEWEFFRVRPANFPTRRIAALAMLVDRWPRGGLVETLADLALFREPKKHPRALEALLVEGGRGGYWAFHCDFGLPLRRRADPIGRQRAAEVAVNVFLPFLAGWASRTGNALLGSRAREIYRLYPKRGDNEVTRYVATQTTGLPRPRAARSACRQQGLLHVFRTWCEVKRCGECPCSTAGAGQRVSGTAQ